MGRYCGEDYETQVPCRPGAHDFAPNGTCWRCRWTYDDLYPSAAVSSKAAQHVTTDQGEK